MNTPGPSRDFHNGKCKHRPSQSKHYETSDSSDEEPPDKKATERKVVKKEGGGTTQKLLRNHSRKLKNEFGMQQ